MKKSLKLWALPFVALSVLTFTSCEKIVDDATETADSGEDYAQDQTAIAAMVDVAQDMGETQGFMSKNGNSIIPENVPIDYIDTLLTDGDGIEIEIDFGTAPGILCNDGWSRYGKITLTSNDKRFSENGAEVTLTVPSTGAGMTKGDEAYSFTMTSGQHIKIGRTSATVFAIEYRFNMTTTFLQGANPVTAAQNVVGNFTVTQTAGLDVPGTADDEYSLQGSSTGSNHNGTAYTMTITEDLVRTVDETCSKTFNKGKMEIKNDGSKTALKLEFGDGTCDNDVNIILPGGIKQKYTVK